MTAHVGNGIVLDRRAFGRADYRNAEDVGTWVGPSNHCGLDDDQACRVTAALLRSSSVPGIASSRPLLLKLDSRAEAAGSRSNRQSAACCRIGERPLRKPFRYPLL